MARYRAAHSRRGRRHGREFPPRPRHTVRSVLLAILALAVLIGAGLAVKFFVLDKNAPGDLLPSLFGKASPSPLPTPAPTPEPTPAPTPTPTPAPTPTPTPVPTAPPIFDDGTDGYTSSGLYIWNNKAFELFYGSTDAAQTYAGAISSYKEKLGDVNVYNMVVPNHSEFGLPQRIRDGLGVTSQRQNLSDVYSSYTADVKAVDIYDNLNLHNDEYIYFNTDTHWTMLGAYYAYESFCETAGLEPAALDSMKKTSHEGFTGYLAYLCGESCLYENPDTIDLYEPSCDYSASAAYDGYNFSELESLHSGDESMGYSMVLYGDNPLFKIVNHDLSTGRRLVLVKDSYGNALAPFLVNSFDEVHVIDFRFFPQKLPAYCQENGITDVLFFNNVMSANTWIQIQTMNELF